MSFIDDPTANEALANLRPKSRYLAEDTQKLPTPPKSYPLKVALCKASGKMYDRVKEVHKLSHVDFVSLDNDNVVEVHKIASSMKLSTELKIVRIVDNTVYFNTKLPHGVELSVEYTHKVY